MRIFAKLYTSFRFYLVIACSSVACASDSNSEPTNEIESVAEILVERVLNRDIQILATFADDECNEASSDMCIEGMTSATYDFIFNDNVDYRQRTTDRAFQNSKSVYTILRKSRPNIHFKIEQFTLQNSVYGKDLDFARIYFYDPDIIEINLPLTEELRNRWMIDFVTCLVVKVEGKWHVAYTLFEGETDGP